jgi:hypothetical protein
MVADGKVKRRANQVEREKLRATPIQSNHQSSRPVEYRNRGKQSIIVIAKNPPNTFGLKVRPDARKKTAPVDVVMSGAAG